MSQNRLIVLFSVVVSLSALADNLHSYKLGNTTVTEGTVNGQRVRLYSSQMGNSTVTRGSVGGQNYQTSSQPLGGSVYTSGHVGNSRIGISSSPLGNSTISSGRVGDSRYQATTYGLGNSTVTSGRIGDSSFSHASQNIGGSTVTRGSSWQMPRASGGFSSSQPQRGHIVSPLDPGYRPYRPEFPSRPVTREVDRPTSFHSGSFSSPAWNQPPLMTPEQTYSEALRASERHARWKIEHDPVERRLYNEFMQKAYEMEAQMIANTFGSHSDTSNSYENSRQETTSWFGWLLGLICILTLSWWLWRNRKNLRKREFWNVGRFLKREFWKGLKRRAETMTIGVWKFMRNPSFAALMDRGKKMIFHCCPSWLRIWLEGGPKRKCKICGTENSVRQTVCSGCGIVLERSAPTFKQKPVKGKGRPARKGPYSRLRH